MLSTLENQFKMRAEMETEQDNLTIVLYGLERVPETDVSLFAELSAITARRTAGKVKATCFKYNQRPDCIAHGGSLYIDGGRKG